jgi:hypothetical protein
VREAAAAPRAPRCAREKLQAAIEKLESRTAGENQATGTSSQDVQLSGEEIESVEELADELAAVGK